MKSNKPENREGSCFICGVHLDHYDSKHLHNDGRIACAGDHLEPEDRWTGIYEPKHTPALVGSVYWTDG